MKIGAVWFDDTQVAKEGWASDGGPAERINGHGALSSDIAWINNLPYPIWKKLNFNNTANILDANYMRTSLDHVAKEIGSIDDPQKTVTNAAIIFNRISKEANKVFGVELSKPGYRYSSLIQDRVTPTFMRAVPEAKIRQSIIDACKQATQENQAMSNRNVPTGSSIHSFIFPRGSYGKWLLSQPVPINNRWTEIKKRDNTTIIGHKEGEVIKGTKAVLKKLIELGEKKAILMRVVVKYMDKMYRPFANFSSGSNHLRGWATLPEILMLSRYSVIELHGGFMTELGHLKVSDKFCVTEEEFSYSHGLFLENLWVSFATNRFRAPHTAVAAYLRSYDRLMCFKAAEKLSLEGGFVVGSYGTGRVQVYLRENEIEAACSLAKQTGLIPQLSTVMRRVEEF